jgi:hypothetical protein
VRRVNPADKALSDKTSSDRRVRPCLANNAAQLAPPFCKLPARWLAAAATSVKPHLPIPFWPPSWSPIFSLSAPLAITLLSCTGSEASPRHGAAHRTAGAAVRPLESSRTIAVPPAPARSGENSPPNPCSAGARDPMAALREVMLVLFRLASRRRLCQAARAIGALHALALRPSNAFGPTQLQTGRMGGVESGPKSGFAPGP